MTSKTKQQAIIGAGLGVVTGAVMLAVYVIVRPLTVPPNPTIQWRIPMDNPPVRTFKIESTPVDVSLKGTTPPVWTSVGTYDSTLCYIFTTSTGKSWFVCSKPLPDKNLRYRVAACNNAPIPCGPWTEEPVLACVDPNNKSGCPCGVLPSAPGCVP